MDPDSLYEIISFEGFGFYKHNYRKQEVEILQPRLEELGYTNVSWHAGESDSFGPLTRICKATDPTGKHVRFMYG
jgi:hypothetical protein